MAIILALWSLTLESLFSVPKLLQFVEVFVQDKHFGYAHGGRRHLSRQQLATPVSIPKKGRGHSMGPTSDLFRPQFEIDIDVGTSISFRVVLN